jgi:hypothetical protein
MSPRLREEKRFREQRILGIKTGVPTYTPEALTIKGFKLIFYNTSQLKIGEVGADIQLGKLSSLEWELMSFGCGAFSFVLGSLPAFPVSYRTRVDVHPYFSPSPWFSGFIQTIPKAGQKPPYRYVGFGFFEQLDWVTVTESYQSQEISVILKDIIENTVAPNTQIAYNASKIEATSYTVTDISFDHTRAKDAIQQLANLVEGYEFGVDDSREFYFRAKGTDVNYYYWAGEHFQDVEIEEDPLSVRNKLYVKAGQIQAGGTNIVGTVLDATSISTYGLREELVTAPDILDGADALAWAEQILTDKKNPKIKAKVVNVFLDQTQAKIVPAGKIRITAHEGTAYELPIDRVLYRISKEGILAELDCEQNPHPLEEILTEEIKASDDEQRLSDKRTKELYVAVAALQASVAALLAGSGVMYVSSDVANSTQVMANVTGLSFAVEANKKYNFRFVLKVSTTVATCGIWLQFTGPASPTVFRFREEYFQIGPTLAHEEVSGFSIPTSNPSQLTANKFILIEGILVNGANAGTVQMQFRCEVASQTVTIEAASSGVWRKLN